MSTTLARLPAAAGTGIDDPARPMATRKFDPVPALVRAVARRTPEAPAVIQDGAQWSYRELEARALGTARALQQLGLPPQAVVAVTGPRGIDVIAGMLGVWMNRQVVLPLDPDLPRARREAMLQEATASLVLCAAAPEAPYPCPQLDARALPPCDPGAPPLPGPRPDDPAYVFFTSGTTGRPKGILGSHNALAHFLDWQRSTFDLAPDDRVAQLTGLSFDVVLRDIFLPLTSGAAVCVPPATLAIADPWAWLRRERITRLHAVPSLASVWLDHAPPGPASDSMRTVFFAGEPLTDTLVRRWRAVMPAALEVVNLYGPTETTLAKCWYRVPATPPPGVQPIGHPLPGTQLLLVDERRRLCADGATGEIVIRTPYRTLGYLRPELSPTARFATNPWHDDPEDIVYFTGDLGRRRPDGALDILGRTDDQIKLLGVRIEPQEIAAALTGHDGVRQAFVTLPRAPAPLLTAYVVADEGRAPARELTAHLARLLPAAMIPRRFVYLEHLPVTAAGKLDRDALPTPADEPAGAAAEAAGAPRPAVEQELARLWSELLHVRPVLPGDSFFRLGGHSLLAAQLVARVRAELGVDLEMHHVFEHPTLESLALFVSRLRGGREPAAPAAAGIRPVARHAPAPVSFAQERLWFLTRLEPGRGVYNIPGAVRFEGTVDLARVQECLDALVARHASLRTRFLERDGAPLQVIEDRADLVLQHYDFSSAPDTARPALVRQAARQFVMQPFYLGRAPLARAALLKETGTSHVLVYALHHTIADGWSNVLFNREFQLGYAARRAQTDPALPALPLDCADFARWERERFGATGNEHLAYWTRRLAGAPARLRLPTDRPRPAVQTYNGASCVRVLPETLTAALRQAFPAGNVTPFMKLLAAFKALLHRLTGERDIVVGTPLARRTQADFESVIGCFINTVALRTVLPGDCDFETLLGRVRTGTLEAFAHQDAPFEKVVALARPARSASHHPVFQVLFNFLHFEDPCTDAGDVRMQREWLVDPETKFDMTLYVRAQRERIRLQLVYNADLFERDRMEGLLRAYEQFIGIAIADPRRRLSGYPSPAPPTECAAPAFPEPVPAPVEDEGSGSATENALAEIWREVLGVDSVSRHDDFFALGGHSLLAASVMARIREQFDASPPLHGIFENPTVARLARLIERDRPAMAETIARGDRTALSVDQQRLWRLHGSGRQGGYHNVPRAVRLAGALDAEALRAAVGRVLERHAVLRTVYEPAPGGVRPRVQDVERVPLEFADLSQLAPDGREAREREIIDREARREFDLTAEYPVRLALLRRNAEEHTLVVTAHHIAADCWSLGHPFQAVLGPEDPWNVGIFFEELRSVYDSLRRGRPIALPELPIQFADFARWQSEQVRTGAFARHASFWRQELEHAPRRIELPLDLPRPAGYTYAGCRREFAMPAGLGPELERFRRGNRATLYVPLLAAFGVALRAWTGQTDMVVGTPVANRSRPETRNLIGPISNAVALRLRVDDRATAGELVARVRYCVQRAFAHQEYPFTQLVEDLGVADAARPPLFQARFVLQQAPGEAAARPGLAMSPLKIDRGVSKYDLSLVVAAQGPRLRGWCEYNTALFRPGTIDGFTVAYLRILQDMLRDPQRTVAGLAAPD